MSRRWHLRTLGESVLDELDRLGPGGAMAEIVAAWPEAVGAAIAENAWPSRVARDGMLVVTTSSSVWSFELTKLETTVQARLAERLSGTPPQRLKFVVGRLPERAGADPVTTPSRTVPDVREEERRRGAEIAGAIENEELRDLVARAAAASLARARGGPDDRSLW